MKLGDIRVQKCSIAKLLRAVDAGRFAIPHLQREFVWDGPKAAKLLDSILRAMPIGVILIWDTPRTQRLHLRQKYHVLPPFSAANPRLWFLIDGQQRVSVLYHVREGDKLENARRTGIDFSKVVLSLNQEDDGQLIRYRRPVTGQYVPLSTILHPQWRQKLSAFSKRKIERVRESRRLILEYETFLMFVHGRLSDIRESFLRVNTQGMKVTTADAIFTRAETLNLRDIVHEIREHIDDEFGDVPDEPLLFLLSAIRGGSEARGRAVDAIIRRLNKEATKDSKLRKSLARDWGRIGPCKWFWATSTGSRYSGRDFNRSVPADLKFFKALARNQAHRFRYDPQVEIVDIRKAQYASRTAITSAVYCMLLLRKPVYLLGKGLNDIPVQRYSTRANRKDRHHIFPRQPLANAGIPAKLYNSISNVCLLVAEENQTIGSKQPRRYLGGLERPGFSFKRKMDRHLIPVDESSGLWNRNLRRGFSRFIQARTKLLCKSLEQQAGIRLFRTESRTQ